MIEVVAAVIEYEGKLLAFQRGASKYKYISHKYEFPGGKVEDGEDLCAALARELQEELYLVVKVKDFLATIDHTYPDFSIKMHCFLVNLEEFDGRLSEHESFAHVTLKEADNLDWIEADRPILKILKEEHTDVFSC